MKFKSIATTVSNCLETSLSLLTSLYWKIQRSFLPAQNFDIYRVRAPSEDLSRQQLENVVNPSQSLREIKKRAPMIPKSANAANGSHSILTIAMPTRTNELAIPRLTRSDILDAV